MAARVLALIAAVAMVVGSVVLRSRLDEGGDGGGADAGGDLRLVCATELAQVCEALRERATVSVEPAGVTADRLAKAPDGSIGLDGWLVPSQWPEIVRAARQRSGLAPSLDTGPVLARSPLVLAVWLDRLNVLRQRCPGARVTWRCWGDVSGQPAAQVKPGHADVNEAVGVATVGAATAGFFGRADLIRVDIEVNDEYRSWLARLERAVPTFQPSTGTAVRDMLLKGPAAFDAVGTIEAEAGPLVSSAARPDKPTVIYPSPVTTVDVVLATVPGGRSRSLSRAVSGDAGLDALAMSGWRVPRRSLAPGVMAQPELPATSGLPDPGILDFLRTLSKEVSR
jgi:Bacterial extracellular solute-binding protein